MKAFVEGMVTANAIQIHYYRHQPDGSPAGSIVFLHAVTDNGLCWQRLAQALPDGYDLVLMDARAHGRSEGPVSGYSAEERAADAAGLIQALGLERPLLVGHAMGAETTIATAAVYPQLLRGVVLEDPPWPGRFYGSTPEERAERASQWREEILQQKALSKEELVTRGRAASPGWSDEDLEAWAGAKKEMNPNLVGIVTAPRRRWSDYLRQAECPILLLTGDPKLGATVSQTTADEAQGIWKNGRCVNIPNAGHSIRRDQFEAYVQAVAGFVIQSFS